MKKLIVGFIILILIFAIIMVENIIKKSKTEEVYQQNSIYETEVSTYEMEDETALEAIRNVLKDGTWVKENLYMKNDCFGEPISEKEQKLTFKKIGGNKVIVQAYAYDNDFGIANTVIAFKDGKVITYSNPELENPGHPGHEGFGIVPEDEILVEAYMHQGFYVNNYYMVYEDEFMLLASFEAMEYDEKGNLLTDENGEPLVNYVFRIGTEAEEGTMKFSEYEEKISAFLNEDKIEAIDIILTDENVDKYVR